MNDNQISFIRDLIVDKIPKDVTKVQRDLLQRKLKNEGLELTDSETKIVADIVRHFEILEGARTADYILRRMLK